MRERRITVLAAGLASHAFDSSIPTPLLVPLGVAASRRGETLALAPRSSGDSA